MRRQPFALRQQQQRRLDMLVITNRDGGKRREGKRTVFVTARVHPGETPASFVCQGHCPNVVLFRQGRCLNVALCCQGHCFNVALCCQGRCLNVVCAVKVTASMSHCAVKVAASMSFVLSRSLPQYRVVLSRSLLNNVMLCCQSYCLNYFFLI